MGQFFVKFRRPGLTRCRPERKKRQMAAEESDRLQGGDEANAETYTEKDSRSSGVIHCEQEQAGRGDV